MERREFISAKLKNFYNKKEIKIKYVAIYILNENIIVKREWKTIMTMKNFLLIDSRLLL